jgi:hypothetical protein
MAPKDTTPHGGEIMQPPNRTIPQPKPGEGGDEPARPNADADEAEEEPGFEDRPSLPTHPEPVAADMEDEEADPVTDSGPGIADGIKSLKKQRG